MFYLDTVWSRDAFSYVLRTEIEKKIVVFRVLW